MKLFGSLTELVNLVFRKNSQAITLRPNQATTYTSSRDIQTPPQDANSVLVSENATQTLSNKTISAVLLDVDNIRVDTNTISSTNTDGDIVLDPNGTGAIALDAHTRLRSGSDLIFQDDDNSQSITVSVPANVTTNRTPQIPDDSGNFVLTTATQSLTNKTLASPTVTGDLLLQNAAGSQPTLQLSEDPDNGTNKVTIQAPATLAGDYTLTLPVDDGTSGQVLATDGSGVLSWSSATGATSPIDIQNVGLATSVAANALTIALKDAAGSDPSAGSPVKVAFRNATAATGTYDVVSVTGALSIVVPSGATLGHRATQEEEIYVYLINNAGTAELAVSSSMYDELMPRNTATISAGATDGNNMYSTTGRTGVAIRLVAVLKITETTPGTWATNASQVGPGNRNNRQPLAWNVYTPTLTNVSNVAGSSASSMNYFQLGNLMVVSGRVDCQASSGGDTQLGISLPRAADIVNDSVTLYGIAVTNSSSQQHQGRIFGDTTNDRATLQFSADHTGSQAFSVFFMYRFH